MAKTAIQYLIEKLKEKHKAIPINTEHNRRIKGAYVDCLLMVKELLEDEKQMVIDTWIACENENSRGNCGMDLCETELESITRQAETYYTNTFNTNNNGKAN